MAQYLRVITLIAIKAAELRIIEATHCASQMKAEGVYQGVGHYT